MRRLAALRPASLTIRVKLTIGFLVAMSLVLGATGVFLYARFAVELNRTIDRGLRSQAGSVRALIAQADTGLRDSGRGLSSQGSFAQVLHHGRVIDYTVPLSEPLLDAGTLAAAARRPVTLERRSLPHLPTAVRLLAEPVTGQDGHRDVAVVGVPVAERDHALSVLATLLAAGGGGALLLAGAVGYGLSTAALRTVESLRRRARTLSLTDPGGRLPVPRARDELWRLATTLNAMLDRNEAAFERERTFVIDAGHELRTPLAILSAELELAMRAGRSPAEIRRAIASAAEEAERLSRLADDLLLVARADQSGLPVDAGRHGAGELLSRVAERFTVRARELGRRVSAEAGDQVVLSADRDWIERALENLVDNALRHGAGAVTLHARHLEAAVELHVCDEGEGFAPDFLPRAFERFSRGTRSRALDGSGVGLAIVRSVARAHGGDAHARNRARGGADVWLTLPAP